MTTPTASESPCLRRLNCVKPSQEAAALVYEMLTNPEEGDERGLYELLAEVPSTFRNEVLAAVLRENMPAQERQATDAVPEPTEHLSQVDDAEQYRQTGQENDDAAAQHPDLERTQHVLKYVEAICGEDAAHDLEKVMHDSRNLSLRALNGTAENYGQDAHELYIQCVADIPATINAKQAMSHTPWDDAKLQEAVQHEVNRMAYRLNLEIQDRLLHQLNDYRNWQTMPDIAKLKDLFLNYAISFEHREQPTYEHIAMQGALCVTKLGIQEAIRRNETTALQEMTENIRMQRKQELYKQAMLYVNSATKDAVDEAKEKAAQWPDETIRDGAVDYHFPYADLDLVESNQARERWITSRKDGAARETRTGDCVTRAINEATGGMNYGKVWRQVTDATQTQFPEKDADRGVAPWIYREVYEQHGFREVLGTDGRLTDPMYRHLDIREIPAMLGHVFDDNQEPFTYIACSSGHAAAVVDGLVHDSRDSRNMGDRIVGDQVQLRDGRLVELWLKSDDETRLNEVQEIVKRYTEVRRYDDVLTYGRKRREKLEKT